MPKNKTQVELEKRGYAPILTKVIVPHRAEKEKKYGIR